MYDLQPSTKPGYWVCTDTLNLVVCVFKEHAFNEDQKFTTLNDFNPDNIMKLAEIGREMGDWLRANHYNKLF